MDLPTIKNDRNLHNDHIMTTAQEVDWSEGCGDTWSIVQPNLHILTMKKLFEIADNYGVSLPNDPRNMNREDLVSDLEYIGVACYDDESNELLADTYAESVESGDLGDYTDWINAIREEIEVTLQPMMNYAYAIKLNSISPQRASRLLTDLPLTIID